MVTTKISLKAVDTRAGSAGDGAHVAEFAHLKQQSHSSERARGNLASCVSALLVYTTTETLEAKLPRALGREDSELYQHKLPDWLW